MADSEKYFTKLVDGQLSVATVAQSGEIIPEETRPGDVYTTALVQTDDGPQLCVKTYDLNGGGGGGGDVPDNVYTQDNLVAGKDISITLVPQPVIDEYTTRLCHFNNSVSDEISGAEAWPNTSISYGTGKFDKGRYASATGNGIYMIPSVSYNSDITVDLWVAPLNHNGTVVDEIFFQTGSSVPSAASSIVKLYNPSGSNHKIEIGKTWSGTGSAETIQWTDTSIVWGNFFHIVLEKDVTNGKVYFFANGKKIYEHAHTASIGDKGWYAQTTTGIGAAIDEARISNTIRWTADFEPFSVPYAVSAGDPIYKINNTQEAGGTVDQTYDPTSTNAQSGTAVAEAVAPALKNKAENTFYSLMIADRDVSLTGNSSVVINPSLISNQSLSSATAVGAASAVSNYGTSVGHNSFSATSGLAVGMRSIANSQYAIAIGTSTSYSSWDGANVDANSVRGIAIGTGANVSSAEKAIQLGGGTNSTANSFQVFAFQLLDGTTGLIPAARIGTGYDATKTQVLKNVNGTLTWVDE